MNKGVIFIISATLFGAAGTVAGYLIAKKKYLAVADREIESMKSVQKQHDENILKLYGIKQEPIKKETKTEKPKTKPVDSVLSPKKNNQKYVDYTHEYAPGEHSRESPVRSTSGVYLISETAFAESEYNYQSLQYYDEDKVVADMDDNYIANYLKLIGPAELWEKELKLDGKAIYIRNDNTEMDYEILYENDRWSDIASPSQKSAALIELDSKQDENGD